MNSPRREGSIIEKGEDFRGRDRYLFEDQESVLFFWDHVARIVRMKFVGEDFDLVVPPDHRVFNEAIRHGREISRAEYESGQPKLAETPDAN